jgi:hypothetical protein
MQRSEPQIGIEPMTASLEKSDESRASLCRTPTRLAGLAQETPVFRASQDRSGNEMATGDGMATDAVERRHAGASRCR